MRCVCVCLCVCLCVCYYNYKSTGLVQGIGWYYNRRTFSTNTTYTLLMRSTYTPTQAVDTLSRLRGRTVYPHSTQCMLFRLLHILTTLPAISFYQPPQSPALPLSTPPGFSRSRASARPKPPRSFDCSHDL